MRILYYIFTKIAECLLPLVSLISGNKKIRQFYEGRRSVLKDLKLEPCAHRYWFHCASLGEFEQARPVMEQLKAAHPDNRIFITFFSPSGFELRKNYEIAEKVTYLPLDTPANARALTRLVKPKAVIFIKYEIWYFYLSNFFKNNIPVYLVSANFRPGQAIFKPRGRWLFRLLPQYKQIFLQTDAAFLLLKDKGLTNILLTGDTRYDRVTQNAAHVKKNEKLALFKSEKPLLILGSSWPKEENILLQALKQSALLKHIQVVIAPHDISAAHIDDILQKFETHRPVRYTSGEPLTDASIMVLDTIGHLASAYYYADAAFIGGGFTGQLHNILEPLSFGVPVITGPVHQKFPEAAMAVKAGVLFEIGNEQTFTEALNNILAGDLRQKASTFISDRTGATALVLQHLQ